MKPILKAMLRSMIAEDYYKLNLEKSYYNLTAIQESNLNTFRELCNFRGENDLGRPRNYMFFQHLKKGKQARVKLLK